MDMPDTIIRVFKNSKKAEKFINVMQKDGYELADLSDGKKHYSITKGLGGALILGPLGLIFGRGKSRVTVTLVKKGNSNESNNVNDLEKLAALKEKGIITEEEFDSKKKQILGI